MSESVPSDEWLLREIPLPVFCRAGGRHLLLHWSTEWKQGQVMLVAVGADRARAERSLLAAARASLATDAHVLSLQEVELVAPGVGVRLRHATDEFQSGSESFWRDVISTLAPEWEAGRPHPAFFRPCPEYREQPVGLDEEDDPGHRFCSTCCASGLAPATGSVADLYASRRAAYLALNAKLIAMLSPTEAARHRGVPSRANPAPDGETIYGAFADHGHHCKGTVLEPADRPHHRGPALFFYTHVSWLDHSPFAAAVAAKRAAERAVYEAELAASEAARAEVLDAYAEAFRALIGSV